MIWAIPGLNAPHRVQPLPQQSAKIANHKKQNNRKKSSKRPTVGLVLQTTKAKAAALAVTPENTVNKMDYNKLIQGGAAGILLTIAFQINNAYNNLTETLKENTRANTELLILHREWFGRSIERNSNYVEPNDNNSGATLAKTSDDARNSADNIRNGAR